ncbi:MAG: GNAT family N-acetyltransferase [Pseudomonadota bacterium]
MDLFAFEAVIVRPATFSDAAAIATIHGDAYEQSYGLTGEALRAARAERQARWPRILGGETRPVTVLVAVVREEVVAFAATYPVEDDWSWEYLASLYVATGVQGSGLGALLLRELADRLLGVGRRRLRALVLGSNARARAFYARMGAREVREVPGELGGQPVTDVVLEWERIADLATAARRALYARLSPPHSLPLAEAPVVRGKPHPDGVAEAARERVKHRLGEPFGLSQFGINRLELAPGCHSAPPHLHSHEDEFVTVLKGEVWLVTGGEERCLGAGDSAGFPAGTGRAHHLENRTDRPAVLLEVGSRLPDRDEVDYPGQDLAIRQQPDGRRVYVRADGTTLDDQV